MIAPTHIVFAEFGYLLILTTTGISLNVTNAVIIGVSSLLPDIDTATSTIGKMFPFLSTRIERKYGHRTLTHSALFVIIIAVITLPLCALFSELGVYPAEGGTCFIFAYASHPFLDTMTVNGVKLFYPFSTSKCVFPLEVNHPHRYRIQTGGKMDKTLAIILFICCIPTFLVAHQGYERFIRTTQHNIEAAVRDYNKFSKDHIVFADVACYIMLTKEPLHGRFEIIGALNPAMLIFRGPDHRLHTLGKDFQADYVAENIVCTKGEPSRSVIRSIDLSNQLLFQLSTCIDTTLDNYFFGDISTTDEVSLPENIKLFSPISGGSNTIKLNHATYHDIREFNLEYVFVSHGIVTIKTVLKGKSLFDTTGSSVWHYLPENYAQFSITLNPKESITFIKQRDDTIHENEIIARKDLAQFFQEQIDLNKEKAEILTNQRLAAESDIEQKITATEQAFRIDSIEYYNSINLARNRFIADTSLDATRLKLQKGKQLLSQLIKSRNNLNEITAHEIRKLEHTNRQLQAKWRSAERQSEIRSYIKGVLIDVRQIQHNNKTQVTFIIRRIP